METTTEALAFDAQGYLAHAEDWTPELARTLASEHGITLTDAHFAVLDYLRERHAEGTPLTIRRIGRSGLVDIKGFYALFPGGPLKVSSRIAGIPKPASCV